MPRLSVSLSDATHLNVLALSKQQKDSMSNTINDLIRLGMKSLNENDIKPRPIDKHCQQLIIQMNALVKNLSAEILKFDQKDFEQLREATIVKYNEITTNDEPL